MILIGNNDNTSNNIFEIYEKKQSRDSLMDKINQEINNISNIPNSKFQANGYDSVVNNINKDQNNCDYNRPNDFSTKTELEIHKGNVCDRDCKCDNCNAKPQENNNNPTNSNHLNNNNFVEYRTVSFKNPEQLEILVEKDKKQACCLIYNNNCVIF